MRGQHEINESLVVQVILKISSIERIVHEQHITSVNDKLTG